MNRKIYYWKLRTSELQLGEKTLVMGVLNITPDSFSDGGRFSDPDRAYARALELEEQGADLIDIGAESTRPDSKRISADEEWQRLLPVLKKLRDKLSIPLSLDTYKSEIAERALEFGVEIFNDPSGLTFDPELAKTAANGNAGLILNHMRGLPEMWSKMPALPDVVGTIAKEIEATASRARRSGVEKNRIVLDPGIGFGKRKEQNSEILAHLGRLAALDYPILVGPSRKAFLAHATGGETLFATAAAVTAAILNGAHIVRVHDVKEMKAVAHVADEIARMAAVTPAPAHEEKERPAERRRPDGARPQAPRFGSDERFVPTRPPLARPVAPPAEAGEAHAEKPPVTEDRPVRRDSDARPPRRDFQDRPPHKPWQDRAPRGRFDDRPPRGRSEDRPPRGPSQDRPFRGPSQDRPSRGPWQDRP
ncbi:MAG TPA: dihydropteroate synthase, partial [Bryobacteraceae bacterium]|nr:dihydropteroate synthase [Bryobacteraceae bacterium]